MIASLRPFSFIHSTACSLFLLFNSTSLALVPASGPAFLCTSYNMFPWMFRRFMPFNKNAVLISPCFFFRSCFSAWWWLTASSQWSNATAVLATTHSSWVWSSNPLSWIQLLCPCHKIRNFFKAYFLALCDLNTDIMCRFCPLKTAIAPPTAYESNPVLITTFS